MDVTQFTMANDPMMTLIKRSVFFGIMAIVAGIIANYIFQMIPASKFKADYSMEIALFMAGFILFFGIHYFGIRY